MDIRRALESEHSKAVTMEIVDYVGQRKKRFGEVVALVTGDDRLVAQRGSCVISHCAESAPKAVLSYLDVLLKHLHHSDGLHVAVIRHIMRAASFLDIPDDIGGLAADLAFEYLSSPTQPVAVKVYAMTVLQRLSEHEPILADELRLHLKEQIPRSKKAAFHSRARKVLAALDRQKAEVRSETSC